MEKQGIEGRDQFDAASDLVLELERHEGPPIGKVIFVSHDTNNKGYKEGSCVDDLSNSTLDFFSPDFDPLKALHAKDLVPPNPRVRPLDNLSSCRRILPEEVPESIINAPAKAPRSAESIEAQERAKAHKSVLLQKAAERERQTKIFNRIAEKLKHGPLGLLAECYHHKLRVKVWTRHTHGIRGTLTGFLVAFDKHINLVLCDIDEEYSVRRWIPRLVRRRGRSVRNLSVEKIDNPCHLPMLVEATNIQCTDQEAESQKDLESLTCQLQQLRIFPKLEYRRRHLKQAFLRGDSVVIVQKLLSTDCASCPSEMDKKGSSCC